MSFVHFTNIASCLRAIICFHIDLIHSRIKVNLKFHSTLNNADFARLDCHSSELGSDKKSSFLWHDQEIPIWTVHSCLIHILIASVNMNTEPILHGWIPGTTHCAYAFKPILRCLFCCMFHRFPPSLWRVNYKPFILTRKVRNEIRILGWLESSLFCRRKDPVDPWEHVLCFSEGEWGSTELLCIQPIWAFLRIVLIFRQRSLQTFSHEMVPEPILKKDKNCMLLTIYLRALKSDVYMVQLKL